MARTNSKGARAADLAQLARLNFEPLLTREEVDDYEKTQNATWGVKRRIALAALTRSRDQLRDGFCMGDSPELLPQAIVEISEWETHCKHNAELASTAVARLIAAYTAFAEVGKIVGDPTSIAGAAEQLPAPLGTEAIAEAKERRTPRQPMASAVGTAPARGARPPRRLPDLNGAT